MKNYLKLSTIIILVITLSLLSGIVSYYAIKHCISISLAKKAPEKEINLYLVLDNTSVDNTSVDNTSVDDIHVDDVIKPKPLMDNTTTYKEPIYI